jgi:hypothetical protein
MESAIRVNKNQQLSCKKESADGKRIRCNQSQSVLESITIRHLLCNWIAEFSARRRNSAWAGSRIQMASDAEMRGQTLSSATRSTSHPAPYSTDNLIHNLKTKRSSGGKAQNHCVSSGGKRWLRESVIKGRETGSMRGRRSTRPANAAGSGSRATVSGNALPLPRANLAVTVPLECLTNRA